MDETLTQQDAEELVRNHVTESGATVKSFDDVQLVNEVTCEYSLTVTLDDDSIRSFGVDDRRVVWTL